jgi:hypothetical protein
MINQLVKFMAHHLGDLGYIWQKGAEMAHRDQILSLIFQTPHFRLGFPIS